MRWFVHLKGKEVGKERREIWERSLMLCRFVN